MLIVCTSPSVVVGDLDLVGVAVLEAEADTPLVVHRDRVLTLALALKRMQPVAGRDLEVVEPGRQIDVLELARGLPGPCP